MKERIRTWLAEHGFTEARSIAPVKAGLGDTTLWRISHPAGDSDLLVRIFTTGKDDAAARERVAMEAAARHDVPAPEVLLAEEMDGQPVLVTTWCPGEPALQVLERSPGDAHRIGMAMGGSLGRLHQIAAPDGLAPPAHWIDRGGEALTPIRHHLERAPDADRLLHLDYHPANVLIDNDEVAGIIDWENTLPGPPHMDVARSRAILRSVRIGKLMPAAMMTALDEFEEGLVAGHASVVGADPYPELSTAWGMAMTVDDLAGQVGKPESWVTGDLVEELRRKRDQLIEAVINI